MSVQQPMFICDTDCIKIAHWLRSLGYDCAHYNDLERKECDGPVGLFQRAHEENRILITRSAKLLERKGHPPHFLIRKCADNLDQDYDQIAKQFNLTFTDERFYSRCIICNCEFDVYPSAYFTGGIGEDGQHYEPHQPFPEIPQSIIDNHYEIDGKKVIFKRCRDEDTYIKCGQLFWWGHISQKIKIQFEKRFASYVKTNAPDSIEKNAPDSIQTQ